MKKLFLFLMIGIFVMAMNYPGSAADNARKKVVKIRASQVEPVPPPAYKPAKIEPQPLVTQYPDSDAGNQKPANVVPAQDEWPTGFFVDLKGGLTQPRSGASLEMGTTLIQKILNKTDLGCRFGVTYIRGGGISASHLSGGLFLDWNGFRPWAPMSVNLGACLNFPGLINNNQEGEFGYNVYLGLNYDVANRVQVFVESGYHSFAIKNGKTYEGVSALLGVKIFVSNSF